MAKETVWDYLQKYNTPKAKDRALNKITSRAFHPCRTFLFKNGFVPRGGVSKIETAKAILKFNNQPDFKFTRHTANRIILEFYNRNKPSSPIVTTAKPIIKKTVKTRYEANKSFYESDAWRALRYQAIKTYGRKCMVCGAVPHPENRVIIHVDHIKPRSKFPELELEFSNLQVLCEDCNLGKSNKDCIDYRQDRKEGE